MQIYIDNAFKSVVTTNKAGGFSKEEEYIGPS